MNKRLSLLAVMFALSFMSVHAQNEQTKSSSKADALTRQARNNDRTQKLDLLRAFENGSIGVDQDSLRALEILAGTGTVWRDHSTRATDFADIRAGALAVLGGSGLDEARDIVLRVVDLETHPSVLAAGFNAIATLGAGDSTLALRVLNDAMLRNMARARSNSVADEYLKAIEVLIDTSNPDLQTVEILTEVSRGMGYSHNIRTRANDFLKSFW
ncbi:hypothetical protein PVA45_03830 [Entomospira entomophila]|uniref:HEAT repeat domain-containing protein n=1 Tax=Entomospira entomophila TaxID=2719988 RepID=A0A968G8R7_9SPIO|nr:hypothetical protein [Entomospira entomophilus]NIZ40640.1 hypothetical protein [Entomospira entomophilus]WDI34854.1 hypothetical protein PVA45_03830 [Entomospira entomophilus]